METLQLFTLCLWTMLQHVKVGHIALSQMVIFIFGLKTPHLIYLYLGPHTCISTPTSTLLCTAVHVYTEVCTVPWVHVLVFEGRI